MNVKEVIEKKRKRNFIDATQIGTIVIPIIKLCNYKAYLYGGGRDISSYLEFFERNELPIEGIIDRNVEKRGKTINEIPYIITDEIPEKISDFDKVFVIITTKFWGYMRTIKEIEEHLKIANVLGKYGIEKVYALDDYDKQEIVGELYGWNKYICDHVEELEHTYNMLYDDESKKAFLEYLRCIVMCEPYSEKHIDSRNKYFFGDYDRDGKREKIFNHLKNEIWVNCGSNIGDTIFLFFSAGLDAKKIYAYEGEAEYYNMLKNNLSYLPNNIREKVIPVNEYISKNTDFNSILEPITFINADIEGNELELLEAMRDRIEKDRPVVAVCIYHKPQDLVEIPEFFDTVLPNSRIIIRKYESWLGCSLRKDELVMYAVPLERV